jgi:hypothetical protein
MREAKWAVWCLVGLIGSAAWSGCSAARHHHGMMDHGKSEAYWQKGQQEMAELVDRTVKDQDKAKQVKAIVSDIIAELKAGREQERAHHRQLYALNASYTAAPEEFMKILDEASNQRMRTATTILGQRFKMKDLMTADEWKALSDQMLAYSGRYQHAGTGAKTGY